MPQNHVDFEYVTLLNVVKTYEALTGLCLDSLRSDETTLWIDWLYADGSWAGTSSYDLPLACTLEKIEQQIEEERVKIEATLSQKSHIKPGNPASEWASLQGATVAF